VRLPGVLELLAVAGDVNVCPGPKPSDHAPLLAELGS
jgi:hypothetical protein